MTAVIVAAVLTLFQPTFLQARDVSDCKIEPESQWAPQGYICPPIYGVGDASRWNGSGVARNDCTFPFDCDPIRVTNTVNGRSIVVTPVTWCMCWVGVTGPAGETERIIDLDAGSVAALGLDWDRGIFHHIRVEPVSAAQPHSMPLPDTGMMSP